MNKIQISKAAHTLGISYDALSGCLTHLTGRRREIALLCIELRDKRSLQKKYLDKKYTNVSGIITRLKKQGHSIQSVHTYENRKKVTVYTYKGA